ncbi:FT-interacting protein 1 [Vitis vinifera]|uniref:FT-interacting protein 1 n=1 Tax=Vitis vinifera TaxID=29760 RepID=A0A438JVQ9_VITVI|nr:FT-interacting protein 1 [Vitis vinifera]
MSYSKLAGQPGVSLALLFSTLLLSDLTLIPIPHSLHLLLHESLIFRAFVKANVILGVTKALFVLVLISNFLDFESHWLLLPGFHFPGVIGDKLTCAYDLVEQMHYLYVRVVKAKDLPPKDVFAFSKDRLQASVLEVVVKDKDFVKDDFMGKVSFDLHEVQDVCHRIAHWLHSGIGWRIGRGRRLRESSCWLSGWETQADEAFPDAWHSDAATVSIENITTFDPRYTFPPSFGIFGSISSKPRTWCLVTKVAADPFEEPLVLTVEDRVASNKDEVLGKCVIALQNKETKFASRLCMRICLEGGYHVFDESTQYSSDFRPTAKPLWKPSIGILEVGILSAQGLAPMKTKDGRGTTDAYCVAKYGRKWVRTRTIIDNFNPKWNEQYIFEVFDPCTVITLGVFDNCHLHGGDKTGGTKDLIIVLQSKGVKKMGEIQLAVDSLRHQATQLLSVRLGRAEPPLRKEVVGYMLDVDSHMWSMRRSKANFFRIMGVIGGLIAVGKWFNNICNWKNPLTTILIHILFVILVLFPELILPTILLYLFFIALWNFRRRPRHPPHMDIQLSHAHAAHPDELDEEFDTFPTSKPSDLVRMRYDRLRSIAGRIQTVAGDMATQGERFQSLLNWRDPRTTTLFAGACLIGAIVLYVTPFQVLALLAGFYILRHPRFRQKLPFTPLNFFRRLPSRADKSAATNKICFFLKSLPDMKNWYAFQLPLLLTGYRTDSAIVGV